MNVLATNDAAARGSARVGLLQVCAAGVLWGTGGLVVTVLNQREALGAMTVSAWRMALAAVALIGFSLLTHRTRSVRETLRRHPVKAVLLGCCTGLYQGLYFGSVLLVGVSVATVVSLGLAPVLASLGEHMAARTRPSRREVAVLTAALVGLALITLTTGQGPAAPGDRPLLGLLMAVASGSVYAATTLLGHTLASQVEPVALTTCATAAGAVALSPFLALAAATGDPVLTTDPGSLALLVYLGVATMALSYGLLYAGLRTTSGSAATVATLVEPLSAGLLAAALLDERLTWPALLGGVLILGAVVALRPTEERPVPA